ncbi:hypothetical protein BaRGS_00040434 [Batillaria attramentaria]|uniref:Uncharacterized protein n=1 Tax=Batillaria attramentaria TaxID=370345 RepID=A0ABD0J042_9CAEN
MEWNNGIKLAAEKKSEYLNIPLSPGQKKFLSAEQKKADYSRSYHKNPANKLRQHKAGLTTTPPEDREGAPVRLQEGPT